ncbi:MAG TPA: hypothetical protein ENN74_02720 [Firmicutes bacterium]|nr:hypothetical protein [Bacillota bacterium]
MKPIRDAGLYLARSVAGYLLFYALWRFYASGRITGIAPWWYFLFILVGLELLGLMTGRLMKRVFDYDRLFMFKMPILAYAFYRMVLELVFLIFLLALLRPGLGGAAVITLLVGLLYLFGVLRHWIRQNRMMIEGRAPVRK